MDENQQLLNKLMGRYSPDPLDNTVHPIVEYKYEPHESVERARAMSFDMYFDRQGEPLELMQWAMMFEDRSYRVVCQTRLSDYFVSTVWVGLTHSCNGEPLGTFETAIFKGPEMLDDLFRHDTQGEAVRWHLWACSMVVRYRVKQLSTSKVLVP